MSTKSKTVTVPFRVDDLLILHTYACLADGRTHLAQMLRRNVSPIAERLLKQKNKKKRRRKESK